MTQSGDKPIGSRAEREQKQHIAELAEQTVDMTCAERGEMLLELISNHPALFAADYDQLERAGLAMIYGAEPIPKRALVQ